MTVHVTTKQWAQKEPEPECVTTTSQGVEA